MRQSCFLSSLSRRLRLPAQSAIFYRSLRTLAIETSCDDTSVALLQRDTLDDSASTVRVLFHEKITSDNSSFRGVHPIVAHESHQKNLASLVNRALSKLPLFDTRPLHTISSFTDPRHIPVLLAKAGNKGHEEGLDQLREKPDLIAVTRGPGMRANLITGLDFAKGLAVAWQLPIIGVNHMQAHALTARMTLAIQNGTNSTDASFLNYPFLTLLISGGHTMLVHSKDVCDHQILANTVDIAVGDMIDKCARDILPESVLKENEGNVMYGPKLEKFAFCNSESEKEYHEMRKPVISPWLIRPPLQNYRPSEAKKYAAMFSFSGIGSAAKRAVSSSMSEEDRRLLARDTMRVTFEHLASRIIFALRAPNLSGLNEIVVSGGVASNKYLVRVIRTALDTTGHKHLKLIFPPAEYCTDNAAMIAWAGMEMYDAGYRTSLNAMALKKWAIDPDAEDGGILGVEGWEKQELV